MNLIHFFHIVRVYPRIACKPTLSATEWGENQYNNKRMCCRDVRNKPAVMLLCISDVCTDGIKERENNRKNLPKTILILAHSHTQSRNGRDENDK